jgi:hypothetical protein
MVRGFMLTLLEEAQSNYSGKEAWSGSFVLFVLKIK